MGTGNEVRFHAREIGVQSVLTACKELQFTMFQKIAEGGRGVIQ